MTFTLQQIVEALHEADAELESSASQYAWFKGQRDHWRDVYNREFARARILDEGPVGKSKEAAEVAVWDIVFEIPWLPGNKLSLAQMLRLTESSFDLVAKEYDRLEKHISILQTVNKNIMLDYQRVV